MKKFMNKFSIFIGGLVKATFVFLVILLILPFVYFAWRAGQPMSMPEYGGRSYYQVLRERQQSYDELSERYQAGHPEVRVKKGMCFATEVAMTFYNYPWAGLCALGDVIPAIGEHLGPSARAMGCGSRNGSWFSLPLIWWNSFERFTYELQAYARSGPVPYCRILAP
jgi:hypothetical protein